MSRHIARWLAISAVAFVGAIPTVSARSLDPELVIQDVSVREVDSGSTTALLGVSLASPVVHGDITVSYSTVAGTATEGTSCTAGVDFIGAHNQTLNLNARQTSSRITVQVCGDTRFEPTETFIVRLFGANGAVIKKADGRATIIENDPAPVPWTGLTAEGTIAKAEERRWQTPIVPAGVYSFDLGHVSGDADLYVQIGAAPTQSRYSCRPAKSSADESCLITIVAPDVIHVMLRGYATSSKFTLRGASR